VLRFRVPRGENKAVKFKDSVFGDQYKKADEIEDFALLRSNGMPTYHMASCADDVDLRIDHIIRGQDHLTNTFKHVLIFEALGGVKPKFAHLPLLIAPDGAKLSKRKHGPVVSVTTYRDAGFLPQAYINFLCLLGWSPKNNREQMSRQELMDAFTFGGVNRSNAVVNFSEADPIDPKAQWLNGQHLRTMELAELLPMVRARIELEGLAIPEERFGLIVETIRARYTSLHDFAEKGRPYFADDFATEAAAGERLDEPEARPKRPRQCSEALSAEFGCIGVISLLSAVIRKLRTKSMRDGSLSRICRIHGPDGPICEPHGQANPAGSEHRCTAV
jgi:glutamyl-tRNA synthetase